MVYCTTFGILLVYCWYTANTSIPGKRAALVSEMASKELKHFRLFSCVFGSTNCILMTAVFQDVFPTFVIKDGNIYESKNILVTFEDLKIDAAEDLS